MAASSGTIATVLQQFELTEFKPAQKQIFDCIWFSKDCIAVLPTGYGKSLPYQTILSAKALEQQPYGKIIVCCPLVSLIEDQVHRIKSSTDLKVIYKANMALKNVQVGLFVSLLAVLADIIATSLPWWSYREEHRFGETWKRHTGLWEDCIHITDVFGETELSCSSIEEPSDHLKLARNMCLFGMLLIFGGILLTFTGRWVLDKLQLVPIIGALAMIVAGFFIWIGVLMFSAKYVQTAGHEPWDMHAGWGLALASSFLCFIAGSLFLWDKRKCSEEDQSSDEFVDPSGPSSSEDGYLRKPQSWSASRNGSFRSRSTIIAPLYSDRVLDTSINTISRLEARSYKQ